MKMTYVMATENISFSHRACMERWAVGVFLEWLPIHLPFKQRNKYRGIKIPE